MVQFLMSRPDWEFHHASSSPSRPESSLLPAPAISAAACGPAEMGSTSSMLTQYDIEEVQDHCNHAFSQQEIVSLYHRFCQLDRNGGGFVSADEFMSVPEFAVNPLSQRLLRMLDGLNFKEFVAFLSAFSPRTSLQQKIEFIFRVYDTDCNGKVAFDDILSILRDLTGSFMTEQQRQIIGNSELKMEVEVPID
ncbi:calcineurin subunit B isoform X1 [Zea mays]|nr:calcineurin subunit B isoform X1 [Zea mays]